MPSDFRKSVRSFFEERCPPSLCSAIREEEDIPWGGKKFLWKEDARKWLDIMLEKGWTAPCYPKKYGGSGLTIQEETILQEEIQHAGLRPPLVGIGFMMLAPLLLDEASDEQKKKYIPPIVRGDIRWCQGYSEPGAGSDLVSLSTSAVRDGNDYIVNGQKIWTSHAHLADWMFCLVRTSKESKHGGISFLLINLESSGVEVRPIELISGASVFCEVFLTDVRVPCDQLIGKENEGWTLARKLLQYERRNSAKFGTIGQTHLERSLLQIYQDVVQNLSPPQQSLLEDKIAGHLMDKEVLDLCHARMLKGGKEATSLTSVLKIFGALLNQNIKNLSMDMLGWRGLGWSTPERPSSINFREEDIYLTRRWLRSLANSIEGGTTEIQRNIIARKVLQLPSSK